MIPFCPLKPPALFAILQPVPMNWTGNPIEAFHDVPLLPGSHSPPFFSLAAQAPDGVRRLCSTPGLFLSFWVGRARPVYATTANTRARTHMHVHTHTHSYCSVFLSLRLTKTISENPNYPHILLKLAYCSCAIQWKTHIFIYLFLQQHAQWLPSCSCSSFCLRSIYSRLPQAWWQKRWKEKKNQKRNNAFVPLHFVCAPETSLVCKAAVTAQIADGTHLVWMLTVSSSVVLLLLDSLMLVQDISWSCTFFDWHVHTCMEKINVNLKFIKKYLKVVRLEWADKTEAGILQRLAYIKKVCVSHLELEHFLILSVDGREERWQLIKSVHIFLLYVTLGHYHGVDNWTQLIKSSLKSWEL